MFPLLVHFRSLCAGQELSFQFLWRQWFGLQYPHQVTSEIICSSSQLFFLSIEFARVLSTKKWVCIFWCIIFSCHHSFAIQTAHTFFHPICFATIKVSYHWHLPRCMSWAGSPELSQSCLGLTQNNKLVSFFTGLFLFTIIIASKTYAFTFSFVLSHFSLVCGGQTTQQSIS